MKISDSAPAPRLHRMRHEDRGRQTESTGSATAAAAAAVPLVLECVNQRSIDPSLLFPPLLEPIFSSLLLASALVSQRMLIEFSSSFLTPHLISPSSLSCPSSFSSFFFAFSLV